MTRASAAARLSRLLGSGTVRVVAGPHPALTGETALGHVSVTTEGSPRAVAERIARIPSANFVSLVGGDPGVVAELRQSDLAALHDDLALVRELPGVVQTETSVYTDVVIDALLPSRSAALTHQPDAVDRLLIRELRRDGRASFVRLGAVADLSPAAARQRCLRLLEGNAIRIGVLTDRTSGDRRLSAGFGLSTRGADGDLLDALAREAGIEFLSRALGRFDVIGTVADDDSGRLHAALDRILSHPAVRRGRTWVHLALLRETYEEALREPEKPAPLV
ncbi:Lrp/AsnC ligand binding domain-containing protein [Schumannella soli]|nr:Lrp/AsnC ligand binding domain-containing protein [Schumannella soli]